MDLMERFSNAGVVPVVVLEDAGQALSTARALLAGGIDVMEITFRTDAARDAIQIVAEQCPDMLVGAGTVCSVEQCRQAAEAGARFIVSPGFDPCVVDWCLEHELTVLPGCVTPSEIMEALSRGISTVKFFPASIYGGLEAMKALSGPFVGLQFVPTGGINAANLAEYAKAPPCKRNPPDYLAGQSKRQHPHQNWPRRQPHWPPRRRRLPLAFHFETGTRAQGTSGEA